MDGGRTSLEENRNLRSYEKNLKIRVRNRWHLALTLSQNPSIRKYRSHRLRRKYSTKHLTKAMMQINFTDDMEHGQQKSVGQQNDDHFSDEDVMISDQSREEKEALPRVKNVFAAYKKQQFSTYL